MKNRFYNHIRIAKEKFPLQFWLLFFGMIISRIGASMTWPFLMVYIMEQLDLPLASVASLMTINSVMGLLASFVAGPIADRTGRKGVMVLSLLVNGLGFLGMIWARTYWAFAGLMALRGAFNPLYQVGSNAMLADILPPEKRDDGYAMLRLGSNLGIAVGPALGGIIATRSYAITFMFAALGLAIYGLLILRLARETIPKVSRIKEPFGGYLEVLKDKPFMLVIGSFTMVMVSATIVWILMAVYAKQNYGIQESQFGLIPMTNAIMVVALQLIVTRFTKRHPPLWVMTIGALLYSAGVGSVAVAGGFGGFWISMVVLTWGELILMPTLATFAANMAPEDKRGRYMSLYSLTWTVATAIGPVFGGFLSDQFNPQTMWIGGGLFGLLGAVSFARLAIQSRRPTPAVTMD